MKSLVITFVVCCAVFFGAEGRPGDAVSVDEIASTTAKLGKTYRQGTVVDRTKLMNDLLNDYNRRVNPDNITVVFGVNLVDIRVHETENILDTHVWFTWQWTDKRLEWDPKEYGGVEFIQIESKALWIPDITLWNSADLVNMVQCWDTNAVVRSSGKINLIPPCKMSSQCSFTLKKEPFEEQTCSLKLGSWSYDGNVIDYEFSEGRKEMELMQLNKGASGFDVVSTSAEKQIKFYPGYAEPYINLTYNMTIKRTKDW